MTPSLYLHFTGAVYHDTILHLPGFPEEDSKSRCERITMRRGGNCPNTLSVLAELRISQDVHHLVLEFIGTFAGSRDTVTSNFSSPLAQNLAERGILIGRSYTRADHVDPASYILSTPTSRTIISHNDLPELTSEEFIACHSTSSGAIEKFDRDHHWYHFEGRNVDNVKRMIEFLRTARKAQDGNVTISVEVEKPNREGLLELADLADVVFFSWAYAEGWFRNVSADVPNEDDQKALVFLTTVAKNRVTSFVYFLTHGANGVYVLTSATSTPDHVHGVRVANVLDTTGAGDTFIAGAIWGMSVWRLNPNDAAKVACLLAGTKCGMDGLDNVGTASVNAFGTSSLQWLEAYNVGRS
ncbi:Ribokinase-like protein [Gaertneriomyces semiglobifer]|nr:Ribokinase-like protein [Gaertneriomyces semiglobifer]